jgi:dihydroorotase-like cyclic amidohydrolase
LSRLLCTGGTVVTAEGSFRADVLVEGEKIVAVGADLPANCAETVDASGKLDGNVDYTPYEGMTFYEAPASVYVRGNLVYRNGEVVGERGSGRFIERSLATPGLEVGV